MSSGVRLCFNTGVETEIEIKENGRFTIHGPSPAALSYYIELAMSLTNVSEVFCAKSYNECVEKFIKNESDFSFSPFSIHDTSGLFSVPVPAFSTSLHIMSGYNIYTYQKEQQVFAKNMPSVLANFASFSREVYSLIAIWMFFLLFIIGANVLLIQRKRRVLKAIRKSFKYFVAFIVVGSQRWFLPSLVLNFGIFLLVTPFCILFKTNQVIIEEPKMVTNYKQIIDQNVKMIHTGLGTNESVLFQLASNSRTHNLMSEIFNYFKSNSRKITMDRSPKTFQLLPQLAKSLVQGKQVIIGSDEIIEPLRQLFCSWTNEDELYQMLSFRDPIQEDIILGFTIHSLDPPKKLVKKLLQAFEGHIPSVLLNLLDNYVGIEFLPTSPEHRQQQLFICQQRTLIPHRKEEVVQADLAFFIPFLAILRVPIFISAIAFVLEIILRRFIRKAKKRKKRKSKVRVYSKVVPFWFYSK